jgi:acetohydroxy acid isomeroreductase-like protein
VITEETRAEMRRILDAIQDGSFAREWLAENRAGRANFERLRKADHDHEIERVGAELRAMMPWSEEGKRGSGTKTQRGSGAAGQGTEKTDKPAKQRKPRRPAHPLPR